MSRRAQRLATLMAFALPLLIAGCDGQQEPTAPGELVGTAVITRVYSVTDHKLHNVFYVTMRIDNANSTAISCVPLAYSKLHQENDDVTYR